MNESDVIKYLINLQNEWEKKRTRGLTSQKWQTVMEADMVITVLKKVREEMVSMAEKQHEKESCLP